MNLDHTCLLNTPAYRLAISRSGNAVLDLLAMSNILRLLQVNLTMSAGQLRPFLIWHIPSHVSLLSKFISNFCTKAIKYLGVYGLRELTNSEASQLLTSSTTLEQIATDSSINTRKIQRLLMNVMGKGDFRDVIKLFKGMKTQSPKSCFSVKENKELQPEAIIWTTVEIRKDLVRHYDKIFIDMRKASINDIGWCYFAPVVKDNENMIRVEAECLC